MLKKACGITYEEAKGSIHTTRIEDVELPFANSKILWLKQTGGEKDHLDLLFLKELLKNQDKV